MQIRQNDPKVFRSQVRLEEEGEDREAILWLGQFRKVEWNFARIRALYILKVDTYAPQHSSNAFLSNTKYSKIPQKKPTPTHRSARHTLSFSMGSMHCS